MSNLLCCRIRADTTNKRDLESAVGKLKCELALSNEQNTSFQQRARDLEAEIKRQADGIQALKELYEEKFKERHDALHAQINFEAQRAERAEDEITSSRAHTQTLQDKLAASAAEINNLQEQLNSAKMPDPRQIEEVNNLRATVRELETERDRLQERTRNIDIRYRHGELVG